MPRYRNAGGRIVETSEENAKRISGLTKIADRRPAKKAAAKKSTGTAANNPATGGQGTGQQD